MNDVKGDVDVALRAVVGRRVYRMVRDALNEAVNGEVDAVYRGVDDAVYDAVGRAVDVAVEAKLQ
jgi:hypothetical protein